MYRMYVVSTTLVPRSHQLATKLTLGNGQFAPSSRAVAARAGATPGITVLPELGGLWV
jgi:hypothetical protein